MRKIILITDWFPIYDSYGINTGKKEFVISHGYDIKNGKNVVLPNVAPLTIGAIYDNTINEWILYDDK